MAVRDRLLGRVRAVGHPLRVGLVGAGQMGRGLIEQVHRIEGMDVAAVADMQAGLAESRLRAVGIDEVVTGDDADRLGAVVADGGHVAVTDAALVPTLPVDVVIDASGVPSVGADVALQSLLAGRNVGLMTVETDVTIGLLLSRLARATGRVYSVCRGDEPVEAKRLVDYALDLGFEVVCAGKGKNNRFDRAATPASVAEEAARRGMNPKMLTSFVDGSKTMIEMAALANATGLAVSCRGLHGPTTTVDQLADVFTTRDEGGVLDRAQVVDYAMGPVAPGVFCVARTDSKLVREAMAYLKMGDGPTFAFYRPYHLANIEAALTAASAVLDGTPDLAPIGWTAEVVAVAKRDLHEGDRIDGIGGETVYGLIESADVAAEQRLLPLGLAANATVGASVPLGQPLTYADVELDETRPIHQLRRLQDALLPRLLAGDGDLADLVPACGAR